VIARKYGPKVQLYSRRACEDNGTPSFDHIRSGGHDGSAFLYVFDLIELSGDDLRRKPLVLRKATLASLIGGAAPGLRFNEHLDEDGPAYSPIPATWGCVISKPKSSPYRSGRSPDWLKSKNPACAAVKREEKEDFGHK
jgi:bifunctional non-homologous end joining protein LigD